MFLNFTLYRLANLTGCFIYSIGSIHSYKYNIHCLASIMPDGKETWIKKIRLLIGCFADDIMHNIVVCDENRSTLCNIWPIVRIWK